jgi:hypothetical protein
MAGPTGLMPELELTRSRDDRRLYEIAGVGTLRRGGMLSRGATAEAGGRRWELRRRGIIQTKAEASDAAGSVVGSFDPRKFRRGGALRWGGHEYALRPASRWKERYALVDGDRELAVLHGKGWGKRPVKISVDEGVEPGLLLFAAYVVNGLAEDASAAASSGGASG